MHLRGTFGISSLALDAKLVPLYRYMAQTADREAGISTPPSSNHRYSTAAAKGSSSISSSGSSSSGGGAGGDVGSPEEAERVLQAHWNRRR